MTSTNTGTQTTTDDTPDDTLLNTADGSAEPVTEFVIEGGKRPNIPPVDLVLIDRRYTANCPKDGVWLHAARLRTATGDELDEIVWYFIGAAVGEHALRELRGRVQDTLGDQLQFVDVLEAARRLFEFWYPRLGEVFEAMGITFPTDTSTDHSPATPAGRTASRTTR